MDIAAMSMSLANSRLAMNVSTSVAKKAMESAKISADGIDKMLEAVEQMMPSSDHILDVRA